MRLILLLVLPLSLSHAQSTASSDLVSPELRAWSDAQGGVFRVGVESTFRPYVFSEEGEIAGVGGDYLRLLSERLEIEFHTVEFDNFADILDAIKQRQIDLIPFILDHPDRREFLSFTPPFFDSSDRVFMRNNETEFQGMSSLAGRRVGHIEGYVEKGRLLETIATAEMIAYPNELMALRALTIGNIDALVADLGVISYYLQQENITNLRIVGDNPYSDQNTIGVRSDWPQLTSILSVGLNSITPEEHAQIFSRWISISDFNSESMGKLLRWLFVLLLIGAACAIGTLVWAYSLKRLVAKRTLALESELSERKKIEAENYRLATAVEQSAEYVLIVNKEGVVEYANLSFFRLSAATDVLGNPLVNLLKEQDKQVLEGAFNNLKRGEVWRGKIFIDVQAAEFVHVAMTITPIQGESSTDGYVVTGRDISHEEALEQKLRHGEKLSALGTMAGGIAHDFNNLLVPILGFTDLISKDVKPELHSALQAINNAALRAQDLVQRILIFSRQNEGKKETIDLGFEIRESLTFLRSLLPSTIEIRSKLASEQTILGDETQIQQIILNLGTNASDAMPEKHGLLEFELDTYEVTIADAITLPELERGHYSRIVVKDDGCGMSQQQQKHMFDPYYSSKPLGKGTGLGLASVHGIIKNHGGAIRVSSSVGEGTEIELFFPQKRSDSVKRRDVVLQQIPKGKGEQVLLVDDDELVLDAVGYMLDRLGYDVTIKSDPLEALQTVRAAPNEFEAILTDFTMPNMTGTELADEVHAFKPDLPVVLMTGKTELLEKSNLASIGKPFRVIELATTLSEAM